MADSGDRRLADAIGYTVSEYFSRQRGRLAYLVAARLFWNEHRIEPWNREGLASVRLSDPRVVEFGYFLYQKALVAREPYHQWQSSFDREAEIPRVGAAPLDLTAGALPIIQKKGECQVSIWGRSSLVRRMQAGEISASEAAAEVDKNRWPRIPAVLASTCELPNGRWLPLGNAIVAMITGKPISPAAAIDQRLAPDIVRLAIDSVIEGAFADILHLYGRKKPDADFSKIESWRFQRKPQVEWQRNRLVFAPEQPSKFLTPKYRLKEIWNDVLAETATLEQWIAVNDDDTAPNRQQKSPRQIMSTAKKKKLLTKVQEFLVQRYKAMPDNQPLPPEPEDHKVVNAYFQMDVPRDDVFRPARRAALYDCGREAKPGPRGNKELAS
jgi:hypothetical protein